jgi:MFS-type transporter involved in bile tolerance (Atg22 family)
MTLSAMDLVYLFVLVAMLTGSIIGVMHDKFDDNTLQRAGMVFMIFGCTGEIYSHFRPVSDSYAVWAVVIGALIFGIATAVRAARRVLRKART